VEGLAKAQASGLVWADGHRIVIGGVPAGPIPTGQIGVDIASGRTWPASSRYFGLRSPDGSLAADTVQIGRRFALRVANVRGGKPRTVARVPGCWDSQVFAPAIESLQFTRDGRSLVYQSYCPEPSANLYAVAPDGSDLRRLTRTGVQQMSPRWSPDGGRIVFTQVPRAGCNGCPSTVRVANADGSQLRQLTRPNSECGCTVDEEPSWSPDGKRIVFDRSSGVAPPKLFVVSATGGVARDLHVVGMQPAWGPRRIAYVGFNSPGIWTIAPDGSHRRLVASGGGLSTPAWSRDGRLAYVDRTDDTVAFVVVNGGTIRRVWLPLAQVASLAWSPNGTQFVLTARPRANAPFDVFTVDTDGSHLTRVTENLGASGASWRA
jgi:Tol biopolymer transport system component